MKKILIVSLMIFIVLFNSFNTTYAIIINPIYDYTVVSPYNLELLTMLPKTICSMNTNSSKLQVLFKFIEKVWIYWTVVKATDRKNTNCSFKIK